MFIIVKVVSKCDLRISRGKRNSSLHGVSLEITLTVPLKFNSLTPEIVGNLPDRIVFELKY